MIDYNNHKRKIMLMKILSEDNKTIDNIVDNSKIPERLIEDLKLNSSKTLAL